MATILLQAAGAALGGIFGPVGSAIGAAAGALAGYTIDTALINGTRRIEGPRLTGARPFTAEEGVSLPRVYGAARVGGTMIWATRFEEDRTTRRQGKTGPKVTEYSYFANVAFALCEGEIAGIRRIWADGREVDRETIDIRIHTGSEAQDEDPLIAAKQGADNTPAYRGTAYAVLERLALADYGNRIPQVQFEVLRPVGETAKRVKAVALIPGATEYGLSPTRVTREKRPGETEAVNRHVLHDACDLDAALDELQACCPNLEHVALVVSWFGDDLRAGECRLRPAVTTRNAAGLSATWRVSGADRDTAMLVSTHEGGAAYGGTPTDRSVMDAIAAIRGRGLTVMLYPFVMMDVPAGNALPDPHGGTAQPAYPWRGRITCMPGPSMPDTVDGTAAARTQVDAFCGAAEPGDFSTGADTIGFAGAADDWGYRRFVLHHARLAMAAGGVDAFLIGSELRGLTTLRDGDGAFPFVEALCTLAEDVRAMLGPATKISYGGDWSEYFGHHPADGNVHFHLDPLWSHPAIDAVGIDNYMPLADWRDEDYGGGNPDGFSGPCDPAGLRASIAGGEGFDWYYPDTAARLERERAPIADGAFGKPWMFRYKDLVSWWSQPHHERVGGVEATLPTGWVPTSKPIWFTELGCPAVDKGPNQPNVFPDSKSTESALPYFSSGGRSDIAQQRLIEAHATHWDDDSDGFDEARNPISPVYGGRMVDASRQYLWAWDARPFPAFPLRGDRWSDNANWHYGHWLNGRLGTPTVGELINAILADHGLPPAEVTGADGTVQGYVIADPNSAREALEPICDLFGLVALERANGLAFRGEGTGTAPPVQIAEMVVEEGTAVLEKSRTPDHQLPAEAVLSFRDPLAEYQTVSVRQARTGAPGSRQETIGFPGSLDSGQGRALLGERLRRQWSERERISFAVTQPRADVVPGALVRLDGSATDYLVTEIEDGLLRKVTARQVTRAAPLPWRSETAGRASVAPAMLGRPLALFLDLPAIDAGDTGRDRFLVAAWQKPWKSQTVFASPEDSGYSQRATLDQPADIGRLVEALPPGNAFGRVDHSVSLTVELFGGEAASASRVQLLNGANAVAVRSDAGAWEVLQFESAAEIAPETWRLRGLLRGQLGTDDAAAAGAGAGAWLVVLDAAVRVAGLQPGEEGLALHWRVGRSGAVFSNDDFTEQVETGGLRALRPLSPVHLRSSFAGGDLALSWIRRGRINADGWTALDIPLGEDREEYRVDIAPAGGAIVRSTTVATPAFSYTAAAIAADFGAPPAAVDVTVRQLSVAAGWGLPLQCRVSLG